MTICLDKEKNLIEQNGKFFFSILLILLWGQHTLYNYVLVIFKSLPIINYFAEFIFPVCVIVCIILALPYFIKCLTTKDYLFFLIALSIALLNFFIYPQTSEYLELEFFRILGVLAFFFIGRCFDLEQNKKILFWLSLIGVFVAFLYQAYSLSSGKDISVDNMDAAYKILPSVFFLIYYAVMQKKIIYWLISVPGIILEFRYGTRGTILCIIIFLSIITCVSIFKEKNKIKKLVGFVIIALVVYLVCFTDLLLNIAIFLSESFSDSGYSTRIFDFFIEGTINESKGRENISKRIVEAILGGPVFGYGLLGDRIILDGSYTHNIVLELCCQFGIILGVVLFIALLSLIFNRIIKSDDRKVRMFIVMMTIMVLVKLMLSSSYLYETWLFFLLGICFQSIGKRNRIS